MLLGFENLKKYTILYDSEKSNGDNISWLQSLDEQNLAIPVVNPLFIKKDYNPIVNDELLAPLGELGEESYFVLVTMRVSRDVEEVSCNLKAPIVINPKTLLGCQVIVENDDLPVRYFLTEAAHAVKEKAGD